MMVRTSQSAARRIVRAGFTLMELLVVVAILVVLAGTGGVIYMNYLEGAREDVARTQVQALTQAAEAYKVRYGDFPPSLAALTQPASDGKVYLEPSALLDPWQRPYNYANPGSHHPTTQKPDIWSGGKDGNLQLGNWSTTGLGG
jgi:general secretion pathway protein G